MMRVGWRSFKLSSFGLPALTRLKSISKRLIFALLGPLVVLHFRSNFELRNDPLRRTHL